MDNKNIIYKHECGWLGKKDEMVKPDFSTYFECPNCRKTMIDSAGNLSNSTKEFTGTGLKPLKPKPQFYAVIFPALQEIAQGAGYNLVLHGSMNRDLDLICIPWIDKPESHLKVLHLFDCYLNEKLEHELSQEQLKNKFLFSMLPGGRFSYIINIRRMDKEYVDHQYYLDISFTPLFIPTNI